MTSEKQIEAIRKAAINRFPMSAQGIHGPTHWERVHENAVYLAKHAGADLLVVRAFAYLHDCCRESDGSDFEHGRRAAEYARSLMETIPAFSSWQLDQLCNACELHEKGRVSDDPTIGTCWDADRLDLGRVGIKPNPKLLSTERAKSKTVIDWAYKRSRGHKARLKR